MELRPYQNDILNQLRMDWKANKTHLIQAPTGAGKTIIASSIAKGFYDRGLRILFTVPRTALIDQTVKAFLSFGINDIGVQQADHEMTDPSKPVQVGTIQTLARRGYDEFDCIIVDECHIKNVKLIEQIDNSDCKIIGLTATPYADWLGKVYDNFIKKVTMSMLMELGYLSQYEFFAPTKPDLKGVKTNYSGQYGVDYNESDISEVMQDAKIAGDIIKTWLKHGESRPTIAFCCNVLHANFLTLEFRKAGINAEVMVGTTPGEERKRIFREFKDGIVQIILSVDVLVEGFDSDVRCIIYAKPTKSEMRWIQSIGRGVRMAAGKDKCLILDHSGTVLSLGQPHQIEYETLFSHGDEYKQAKARRKEEATEKKDKECPSCHYIKPAGQYVCEKCGFKPIFGQDGDVDESLELESMKVKTYTKAEKQQFYSELIGYWEVKNRNGKSWSKGWVAHKYREKFSVWPKGLNWYSKMPTPTTENWIKHLMIKYSKAKK